ncbi:MAG: hypothetical protein ACTIM4_11625 [Marinomonas sp.]
MMLLVLSIVLVNPHDTSAKLELLLAQLKAIETVKANGLIPYD